MTTLDRIIYVALLTFTLVAIVVGHLVGGPLLAAFAGVLGIVFVLTHITAVNERQHPRDGDLGMVCDAYGLPHNAVALARHLVNNAQLTIENWKAVVEIHEQREAAVLALADRADNLWARSPGERDRYVSTADLRAALAKGKVRADD